MILKTDAMRWSLVTQYVHDYTLELLAIVAVGLVGEW